MKEKKDGSDLVIPFAIAMGVMVLYFVINWIIEIF